MLETKSINWKILFLFGIADVTAFVLDVLAGGGGAGRLYSVIFLTAVTLTAVVLYKNVRKKTVSILKATVAVMIQIAFVFVCTSLLVVYILASIMINLGFDVLL